jgi:hypothetical protein
MGYRPSSRGCGRVENHIASGVTIVNTPGTYCESLNPASQCWRAKLLRIRAISRNPWSTKATHANLLTPGDVPRRNPKGFFTNCGENRFDGHGDVTRLTESFA